MCGICGAVGNVDEQRLWTMTNTMVHRGPDGAGVRCFEARGGDRAGLGHRRLCIIDPTPRGAQPMSYANERYWITYNGEIYNYRELRSELEAAGYPFHSDCDTEVVLALFAHEGSAMLRRLNGIFTLGIWDTQRRELFLARDRLGVKPLYYCNPAGDFSFASEVKALIAGGVKPRLSHTAVADFLTFLWVPDPDTMFEGVYKLPPGHCATYSDGRLAITQYWDLTFRVKYGRTAEEWAAEVRTSIRSAVRRQRVADVPLGSFLSGGIDSSAIVAELSKVSSPVTTYTVGFSSTDLGYEIVPDDLPYARQIAKQFGADYHERVLEANVVDLLPKLVWHMDEPVADPAAITTYLICAEAREDLTVILSGMGGDEVFAGYPRYLAARLAHGFDLLPAPARASVRDLTERNIGIGRAGRMRGPRRNIRKLVHGLDQDFHDRYLTYCSYYRAEELARLLHPDLARAIASHDPFARHRAHLHRVADQHWLNQLLYLDAKTFLPCLNLTYTDKMSMAASAEVRVPLLDDELISLAAAIPPDLKLRRLQRKYIFKRSMVDVLPRSVISRPKAGFGAPVRSWLIGELAPLADELLAPAAVRSRGLLYPAEVGRIVDENKRGVEDNALRVWAMLHLELWQRAFIDGRTGHHGLSPASAPPAQVVGELQEARSARRPSSRTAPRAMTSLVVVGPTPPPVHGVSAMTGELVTALRQLDLLADHVNTHDPRPHATIGRLDARNAWLALKHASALSLSLRRHRDAAVYVPISQASLGFLRDAVLVALAKAHGRSVYLHLHGADFGRFYSQSHATMREIIRRTLGNAEQLWLLTPSIAGTFDGLLPQERIRTLANVVPAAPALAERNRNDAPSRLRLLYLGNMWAGKTCLDLLAALTRLGPVSAGWETHIAGAIAPELAGRVEAQVIALRATGATVQTLGFIDHGQKWREFSSADLFVYPTEFDGQPLVLLEAMAAGLPIISSRHGGIPDTIRDGVEGLLVAPGDVEGLATALLSLANDPGRRKALGSRALHRYERCHQPVRLLQDLPALLSA
jgi:asparagine synthase (glutamine-hydrolysing)